MILEAVTRTIRVIETDGTTNSMGGEEEAVIDAVATSTDITRTSMSRTVNERESLESASCWSGSGSNRRRRWTTLWTN